MAFVIEEIPISELDESDLLGSIRTLNGDPISPGYPQTWVIDRERDARLISLGGGGGPIPMMFAFVWKNSNIEFYAAHRSKLRIEGEKKLVDDHFVILSGFIQTEFVSQKIAIEQLIREALISHANNKLGTTTVHFEDKFVDVESLK